VLALDGEPPGVNFASRGPIYVYSMAGILKVFGTSYISGRLLTITCSLLVGIVIFFIAKGLFDQKVALLSSTMYWMLPFELTQSAIVKTEPLAVLLTCLAFYAVVRFSLQSERLWLIGAGVFAALGFYVRASAFIIPLATFAFIVFFHFRQIREVAKSLTLFVAGYGAVVLVVLAYYSKFMSPGDLFRLTPFEAWPWVAGRVLSIYGLSVGSPDVFISQASTISWDLYYGYLKDAFYLHSFLLIGLVFSGAMFIYHLFNRDKTSIRYMGSHCILYLWVLFLFVAYAFIFYFRGFFIDYSREFLPPLVIIFSAWLRYFVPAFEKDGVLERFVLGTLCVAVVLFFMQSHYKEFFGMGHHASLTIALVTLFSFAPALESSIRRFVFVSILLAIVAFIVVSRHTPWKPYFAGAVPSLVMMVMIYGLTWIILRHITPPSLPNYGKFVCLSIVLASFVVGVTFSAKLLSLSYDSAWSPWSVEKIASYLRVHTDDGDEVMSGAVIWELQAQRKPFEMISHPLAFEYGMPEARKTTIELSASAHPPRAIVLDGYTEKLYIKHVPWLHDLLSERYQFVTAVGPPGLPVRLYRLNDEPGLHNRIR
jgi:4-amino-4-deoxy-L-arabinose transferase-like glycosyltransferase